MLMQVTKNSDRPHVIRYQRDDGTITWMKTDAFFVRHDLSHYAVEKTLGYTTAFMGMLNNGMNIQDFEDREKRLQIDITRDACYAENMANLFLIEAANGKFEDFNNVLAAAFINMQQPYTAPMLADQALEEVRSSLGALLQRWDDLPAGETMELIF